MTDLHSHLMPAVDDGARTVAEAVEALRVLHGEGVRQIVTTPHVDASTTLDPEALNTRLTELDRGWRQLLDAAAELALPGLHLARGVELRLDAPQADLTDDRLRLDAGTFVLVEFLLVAFPPYSDRALRLIREAGWTPLLAHPERYDAAGDMLALADQWRRAGAYLQVNAPSLAGRYGSGAQRRAWRLLERGLVDCLASDYHARGRPGLSQAASMLQAAGGEEQLELLTAVNPARIAASEAPLPVPPLAAKKGMWGRMLELLR